MKKILRKITDAIVEFFTVRRNGKRRLRTFLTKGQMYVLIFILAIGCVYGIFKTSEYYMSIDCSKIKNQCVISKKKSPDAEPIVIRQFPVGIIYEVKVEKRKLENGKEIFDILLDNGPFGEDVFIDYGFENVIKANTVKMKMDKYLTTTAEEFSITKRCYFNDYFCF